MAKDMFGVLAVFLYRCGQFFQLSTVDIRINRLVLLKHLKNTTPLQSHQTDNIIFFWCNSAFDVVCGGSSRMDYNRFRTRLLQTIHFSSPVIILLKKESNSLRLRCKSQALMRFVEWISSNSYGIQISSFFNESKTLYMTVDCWV